MKLRRAAIHFPVGIVSVLACYVGWSYGVIFFAGFMAYELNEDMHLTDRAYIDIFGYLVGFGVGVITLFLLTVLGGEV